MERRNEPMSPTPQPKPLLEQSSIEIRDLARMTVEQYDEAARLDILNDPHVELLNGLLVKKKPNPPILCATVDGLGEPLRRLIPNGWYVRTGQPVRLPIYDEPEPDLAIVRGRPD